MFQKDKKSLEMFWNLEVLVASWKFQNNSRKNFHLLSDPIY